ncbi:MAG: sensor histidine kinase [Leadbetterella sp.]
MKNISISNTRLTSQDFKQKYLWFQILGWLSYVLFENLPIFLYNTFETINLEEVTSSIVSNVVLGILLTHYFRGLFKKYNWISLPLFPFIGVISICFVFMTLILAFTNLYLDFENSDTASRIFLNFIINILANTKPILIWLLMYLTYAFSMQSRDNAIEKVTLKASADSSEARILRAQLNPHFIFNALNSIRALIFEDPQKAQLGITQLSNILRGSLVADRKSTVSLKEELATIENYLELEKIRYEWRLQINWSIDPNSLSVQIPPMILHTLAENAIKHGIQKANRWGFVEIKTRIDGSKLILMIRNTGTLTKTENTSIEGGFGLENTKKRLQLLYGNKSSFSIFQEDKNVVCAKIELNV